MINFQPSRKMAGKEVGILVGPDVRHLSFEDTVRELLQFKDASSELFTKESIATFGHEDLVKFGMLYYKAYVDALIDLTIARNTYRHQMKSTLDKIVKDIGQADLKLAGMEDILYGRL